MLHVILLFCLLLGCHKVEPKETLTPTEALRAKRDLYLSFYDQVKDSHGWVGPHCDGLLFNSLGSAAGLPIPVGKAEREPGVWERHPAFDCYPGESKSRLSKDMVLGLMYWAHVKGEKDLLKRLHDRASDHNWQVCDAVDNETFLSRCVLSLSLVSLLRHALGLSSYWAGSDDQAGIKAGFEGHLEVLKLRTYGRIDGHLSDGDLKQLKAYCDHNPKNALSCAVYHRYADGDQSGATEVLMDEALFPADRPPSSRERCEDYLWQREPGSDWAPCPWEGKIHSMVDFLTAAEEILGD